MVQSVDRALAILELLAEGGGEMGVSELGDRLAVHKSTASRLLTTLTEHDLVEQNPLTGKYRLAFGVVRLASAAAQSQDLVERARPVLQDLATSARETVNLSVMEGDQVVSLRQITAPHMVANVDWVGRRTPAHCSSSGKAMLAHLPPAQLAHLLSRRLERRTPRTIVDRSRLMRQLAEVRSRGYASTVEELEPGLNGVAAPIRGAGGVVLAAVSVSGPAFRVTESRIPELGRLVRAAAATISRRMGFHGSTA